jgi:oxygen-independent coproporphyrinogen-3 oxidase
LYKEDFPKKENIFHQYETAVSHLEESGYKRLTYKKFALSNKFDKYSKFDKRRKINEKVGLGVSANSYFNNSLYINSLEIDGYSSKIKEDKLPITYGAKLSEDNQMERYAIMSLQFSDGIDIEEFRELFNRKPVEFFSDKIKNLEKLKMLEIVDNKIMLTDKGKLFGDEVCLRFFNKEYTDIIKRAGYGMFLLFEYL